MYWPNAIVNSSGNNFSCFTYTASSTIDDAKNVINTWKKDSNLKVLCAYIREDKTNSIVYLEDNVDVYGNVSYGKENITQNMVVDYSKVLDTTFHQINVHLDESDVNYVFVEDVVFDTNLLYEFFYKMENSYKWLRSSQLHFYYVTKKNTKQNGTIICWGKSFDFECPYSGYEFVSELTTEKEFALKRINHSIGKTSN